MLLVIWSVTAGVAYAQTSPVPDVGGAEVQALKDAGLPLDQVQAYDATSDPNKLLGRQGYYVAKLNFHDSRLPADPSFDVSAGGSIEVFASKNDLATRFAMVATFSRAMPGLAEYDFLVPDGPSLLRLSSALTPDQADAYRQAIGGIVVNP